MRPTPEGPDPAVQEWPSWPYPTTCGGQGFDPVAVFGSPLGAGAEDGPGQAEAALRELVRNPEYASIFQGHEEGWRLASRSETSADFVWGQLPYVIGATVAESGGAWGYAGAAHGCTPRSIVGGHHAVEWQLAPQPRLRPSTKSVLVRLRRGGCIDRAGLSARADRPRVHRRGGKLLIAIGVQPLPPRPYGWLTTCMQKSGPPLTVKLRGRLGRRTLFDAATYPPQRRTQ